MHDCRAEELTTAVETDAADSLEEGDVIISPDR